MSSPDNKRNIGISTLYIIMRHNLDYYLSFDDVQKRVRFLQAMSDFGRVAYRFAFPERVLHATNGIHPEDSTTLHMIIVTLLRD